MKGLKDNRYRATISVCDTWKVAMKTETAGKYIYIIKLRFHYAY
jgi:hypothetical protein